MSWLSEALGSCTLTDDVEGYFLGRGAKQDSIESEGIVTWQRLDSPAPDPAFRVMAGSYGERFVGYAVCPVWSPRGTLIGFEARNIQRKYIRDYRLPEAAWNPFFIGMRRALPKLWAGGDAWIVEGQFDLYPLEWAVPETDAVLATVRAKLSKWHLEFLRRYCQGWVHMVYDRDETGQKATFGYSTEDGKRRMGALDALQRVGLKSRDVPFTGGKDPGEIWDQGGVKAVQAVFAL